LARRWLARGLRLLIYALPIAGSLAFVRLATLITGVPTGSLSIFLFWWLAISLLATAVVSAVFTLTRRLLPLGALLGLSLVFPDEAPSRFRLALRSGTVESLEERLRVAREADEPPTAQEAAEILLQLVAALNVHDRITRGHAERVRAYSYSLGRQLGLARDELDRLNWAALLHDIGKLEVSADILNKPGKPTEEEWEQLRLHPLYGETLVEPMREWLGEWTEAVGYHHERWDGKGYPRGIGGDEIPLAGRIVAIADVFDVITSARSYKQAASASDGRAEIARCSGTQFDPRLVRAFVNISVGRMRLVMGPVSWLTHAPLLARFPLTPSISAAVGGLASLATAATTGLIASQDTAQAASARVAKSAPPAAVAPRVHHSKKPALGARTRLRNAPTAQRRPDETPAPAATPAAPSATNLSPPAPGTSVPPSASPALPSGPQPPSPAPPSSPSPPPASPEPPAAPPASPSPPPAAPPASPPPPPALPASPEPPAAPPASPSPSPPAPDPSPPPAPAPGPPPPPPPPPAPPVNVAPSFSAGPNQTVLEDSGAHAVAGWATAISPGPANESSQSVSFTVTNDSPALFAVQPALASDGTLTYTPAADANGTATVTVVAHDDGGTLDGGSDTSAPSTFTLTVDAVNDAPRFNAGPNQSVVSVLGAQSVAGWATGITPGPANESAQSVTFTVSSDNPGLFTVQPVVASDGRLTYTPTLLAIGTATVTVRAVDSGGTANGGSDTSPAQTFTITIV
jgi:hypothetical protein